MPYVTEIMHYSSPIWKIYNTLVSGRLETLQRFFENWKLNFSTKLHLTFTAAVRDLPVIFNSYHRQTAWRQVKVSINMLKHFNDPQEVLVNHSRFHVNLAQFPSNHCQTASASRNWITFCVLWCNLAATTVTWNFFFSLNRVDSDGQCTSTACKSCQFSCWYEKTIFESN